MSSVSPLPPPPSSDAARPAPGHDLPPDPASDRPRPSSPGDLFVSFTLLALQGFGGAVLSPATLSIITSSFAEGGERNRALGVWGEGC